MTGFRSGFISLIGRPNVGKSTLVNSLVGEKILSTSKKPQFTRKRVNCILTREDGQLIFIDTPGINRPLDRLGEFMLSEAYSTFHDVDVILFVLEANLPPGAGDAFIARKLEEVQVPILLALNKVDLLEEEDLILREKAYGAFKNKGIFLVSARDGTNIPLLTEAILHLLPEGPMYYPQEMITDNLDEVIMADMIREKVFFYTHQEVPYGVEVVITEIKEREEEGLLEIYGVIFVEQKSQKGILIGRGGLMLKQIGQAARYRIQEFFATKVYLNLWVKVRKNWRDREESLSHFGYRR